MAGALSSIPYRSTPAGYGLGDIAKYPLNPLLPNERVTEDFPTKLLETQGLLPHAGLMNVMSRLCHLLARSPESLIIKMA